MEDRPIGFLGSTRWINLYGQPGALSGQKGKRKMENYRFTMGDEFVKDNN